jgi:hypothetical protein
MIQAAGGEMAMNKQATEGIQGQSGALTAIQKLQAISAKIEQTTQRAMERLHAGDGAAAGRALVAMGICQQARQQVAAACENMGITIEALMSIDESLGGEYGEYQRRELRQARIDVVKEVIQQIHISREAVFLGIQAFAEESAIIAGMMISRAEQQLQASARPLPFRSGEPERRPAQPASTFAKAS